MVTNPAGIGTVTIHFPPDLLTPYTPTTFGPVEAEGSALKLMLEKRFDDQPCVIKLSPGTEEVLAGSAILKADITSPAQVTIDGGGVGGVGGRILKPDAAGTLFTIDDGVTLILKNITLEGIEGNTNPLVVIGPRGKLILEDGVILTNNHVSSNGSAGAVLVDGGELVMNDGSEIRDMEVSGTGTAGGVYIRNQGRFVMNDGIIEDNKTISGNSSSGGVLVDNGSFEMYDGAIRNNEAPTSSQGAGAVALWGTFTMYGGRIEGNQALLSGNGGAGVWIVGTCNLYGGDITGNTGKYGVYVDSQVYTTLRMKGPLRITSDNKVFIAAFHVSSAPPIWQLATISIDGNLTTDSPKAADIILDYINCEWPVITGDPGLVAANYSKFNYTYVGSGSIGTDGIYRP
jgi:hypothetical protein